MKICLDDTMKQSIPGLVNWFHNKETGVYMLGCADEPAPANYVAQRKVLYDGISNPGHPYVDPDYDPMNLATCRAIKNGVERSKATRALLGPDFTRQVGENKTGIAMSKLLREKRKSIYQRALQIVEGP